MSSPYNAIRLTIRYRPWIYTVHWIIKLTRRYRMDFCIIVLKFVNLNIKLNSIECSWFWYLKKDLLSCISNNVSWSQGPFISKYNNINLSIELQKYFSIIPLIALALSEKQLISNILYDLGKSPILLEYQYPF